MSKKMKCPPKMDKKKPIKPVKAWAAVLCGEIQPTLVGLSKNQVYEYFSPLDKVIRVEIRAI